ncbi:MAG: NAD(P)-binding domain-containing protein [Fuerstiella sp.]
MRKLVVVGAGPIGLEAALRGIHAGFDVTVLERGRVGEAVRRWQHVSLFTPFGMNSTRLGTSACGAEVPDGNAMLSGAEFCSAYLEPLARCATLDGRVKTQHEVLAVSRQMYGKSARIGRPDRGASPFRLLVRADSRETVMQADVLLDCTGFTTAHRSVGAGGIPCPGESQALSDEHYRIPDIVGLERSRYADRHTLVIGSGYSAATSVCLLGQLADEHKATKVTWLTRGERDAPVVSIPDDSLPERERLTNTANQLALAQNGPVTWLPGPLVESIQTDKEQFQVQLSWEPQGRGGRAEHIRADEIIANPGFRANIEPFAELQIYRCYATDGPIRLAAHLLNETSGDCLQQSAGGPDLLSHPEPDFYILGAASYGRDSRFLLQTGLQQIDDLFRHLESTEGNPV